MFSEDVHDNKHAMILIIILLSALCLLQLKGNLGSISMGFHLIKKGVGMTLVFLLGFIIILIALIFI